MKTTPAVLVQTGAPLEIAELSIPPLQPGQVLVEIAFSGVCHTQLLECRGHRGEDRFLPHCLGHEAGATVVEIGPDVTKCRIGDPVILSWIKGEGIDVPGTQYQWNDRTVNAGGVTTFSRHAVVSENRCTVIPASFDLRDAAMIGCAVATGAGAVLNTAQLNRGDSVVVFGVGGIGLSAVMAALATGANPLIVVDRNPARLQVAEQRGVAHLIEATDDSDVVAAVKSICPKGVDIAVEATGRTDVMQQALASVRPRGGRAVVIGNAHHGDQLILNPQELNQGKQLLGTWGGDSNPDRDFPKYCEMITEKSLNLSVMQSDVFQLEEINDALGALESGRVLRPLIDMSLS